MEVDGQRLKNDTVSKLCEPCKEGTVSTQADGYCIDCEEYMCKPCFQSHLKLKLCRNHVFGAKGGGIRQVSKKPETKCKKHTTEVLKYYCRNHDSVGCGDCLVFDHRKCKPEFIRDLAKNIEESFDLKNILKEVDKLEIFKAEIEVSLQKNRSDNTEFHDKAIHEIQKHRSEMNTWLDNVTSKIEAEEMKIWKENESALSRLDDWIKTTNDVIDKVRDEISTEKYTGENLFIRMIECKSEVNEFVTKYVPEIKSNLDIKPFAFEANQKLCVLTKSANLGIIRLDTTTTELKIDERERQSYSTLIKDASNIASSSLPANETEVVGTGYTCTLNSPEKCSTIEEHNTTQEAEPKETAIGQTQTVPVESHQLATKNTDVPNNHEYADALKPGEPISPGAKDEEMPLSSVRWLLKFPFHLFLSLPAEERKLKEPWRTFERNGGWTQEYHEKLLKQIKEQTIHDDLDKARLVFMGPIGAGKSSFINSVASIDKQRVAYVMVSGTALKGLSQKLKQYKPNRILNNCILMDTMGVEEQEEEGFNVQDAIYLMQGNIKPDYRFNPRCPITDKDSRFNPNPSLSDKAHCITIVMDSTVIDSDFITDALKKKIEVLQEHIRNYKVPVVIVLTKIDELCEEVANDIKTTYHSRAVASVVKKAQELFEVPKTNIFPVKNYAEEAELDENLNILIMLALQKMIQIANDRLEILDDYK